MTTTKKPARWFSPRRPNPCIWRRVPKPAGAPCPKCGDFVRAGVTRCEGCEIREWFAGEGCCQHPCGCGAHQ